MSTVPVPGLSGKQPTPDLSHLTAAHYEDVYEPSDDTFLLLDALEKDKPLLQALNPGICLELGPGSGCVITFLAQMLGELPLYMAVDINPKAALATKATAAQNRVKVEIVNGDLLGSISRLQGQVDVLIFNPPYVPTPDDELGRRDIVAAWAGGVDGTDTLDRLMPQLSLLLSPHGCFYCVVLADNKPNEVACRMREHGFPSAKVILKQKCVGELLYIIRFSRVEESVLLGVTSS